MNTAAAVSISLPAAVYVETMTGPLVRNVAIRGATWTSDQFPVGVALTDALRNDGNSTIQHSAKILLKGAVNATPANGSIFKLYRDSLGAWREMSWNY